jgi:midasin (ATPase involved in ribosome maturation)
MNKKYSSICPLRTKAILWKGAHVLELVRELQAFLKTRMTQVKDPTFSSYWVCNTCDRSKEFGCFGKTAEFCQKRGLDYTTFTEILNSFSGFAYNITSDADVLNRLPVKPVSENMAKVNPPKRSDQKKVTGRKKG